MVDGNDAFTTTRRGAIKTGALGLGGLTGAIALGSSEAASAATLPSMDTVAALAGVSGADYFLRLDGITGDSVDAQHQGWVDVQDYSWKATNGTTVTGSGWSASKASLSAMTLSTQLGQHSPPLFLRTMNGRHLTSALVQGMTTGATPRRFVEIEMRDVAVASYEAASGDESPQDTFSLAFAVIRYSIYLQSATGGEGQEITSTWNIRTGTGSGA